MRSYLLVACLALAATFAYGATTATWELNSYQDFLPGKFDGIALTRDGQLQLAPQTRTLFTSDQPFVWSVARDSQGALYLGTGHRGRVYRVENGKGELLWSAPEPEIFALTVGPDGAVYAATSPNGKIYRIERGKAEEYFNPGAAYIWSLAFSPGGALYAGTGDQGKVFEITGKGQGKAFYESGQMHITALAFDPQGRLLAGSEPNGILYRIDRQGKAFVLYDADLSEIRTLIPAADGSIYAAAIGGSVAQKAQAGQAAASAAAGGTISTTVTVTASTSPEEALVPPGSANPAQAAAAQQNAATAAAANAYEAPGVEKSALFRIHPDNTVEKLWSSTEENLYDLLPRDDGILFSTDKKGRLYRLTPDRKETLVAQTGEGEATRIVDAGGSVLIATSNMGKLIELAEPRVAKGAYESAIHDAGRVARWGRLSWQGSDCSGCSVQFRTRSGNSVRPDATWSDWSEPLAKTSAPIQSPNARFLQWKAEFQGGTGQQPLVDSVAVAYLPQNTAPVVNTVVVSGEAAAKPVTAMASTASSSTADFSVTVSASGDASSSSTGTPTTRITRSSAENLRVTWTATDNDGDPLRYQLQFRGEGEREWKTLKKDLEESTITFDATSLADGGYYFRVVATDAQNNIPQEAREADQVSARILIDHTPPEVVIESVEEKDGAIEAKVVVRDRASAVTKAEYSINAQPWTPIRSEDGVVDSLEETFRIRIDKTNAGERVLVVRATDSADNAGLARVVLPN